ncbi:Ribbon-helix-helix protein, copG family [Pyrodictium delaneyi]|uniref:Ribbon-helix-helix protein, copG family n=1 Tax=Pyrodictium delaneyi TaxID=1273541 RepID=A0A0P0N3J4_9CREN|nr:ribbon-helix-helix domain-containing protein [Pyrodictium delaneyi]ALL00741.1 Ribbon-helix-helix protein, copG family [Pyrodictium delaneyi]
MARAGVVSLSVEAGVAARVLAENGVQFFTVRRLARMLGVSPWKASAIVREMRRLGLAREWNSNSYVLTIPVPRRSSGQEPSRGDEPAEPPRRGEGPLTGLRVVTFKLDARLLAALDNAVAMLGYDSRSEIIREALREFLERRGLLPPREESSGDSRAEA